MSLNALSGTLSQGGVSVATFQNDAKAAVSKMAKDPIPLNELPGEFRVLWDNYDAGLRDAENVSTPGVSGSTTAEVAGIINRYLSSVRTVLSKRKAWYQTQQGIPKTQLLKMIDDYSDQNLSQDRLEINQALNSAKTELTTLKKQIDSENDSNRSCRTQVIQKREEEGFMNRLAIRYGLPWFCMTAILLSIGPQLLRLIATALKLPVSSGEDSGASFDTVVELITVLLVTMTILILGLASKIDGQVLGTLLGGISGYVLNRIKTRGEQPDKSGPRSGGGSAQTGSSQTTVRPTP
jgi:hypothetical protein